jgi:hypothetical protein
MSMQWFERAARGGNAFAQARLGDVLTTGIDGVQIDVAAAATWYERAASQGHTGATLALTSMRMAAGAGTAEMSEIFRLWLQGAERGDATAQRMVGEFYLRGTGVESSMAEAERWLGAAAEQGNAAAMTLLAASILQDSERTARLPEAIELLQRAAALGNADADYNLGVCLRRGLGVPRDVNAADRHYRSAAERKHVSAQLALADSIAESANTDAAWLEAAHWYRLAADGGSGHAKARLLQVQESMQRGESGPKMSMHG